MSSTSRAWILGTVEALKDQGFCRWNHTLRSIHQHAKNRVRSFSQAKKLSPPSSTTAAVREKMVKQSGESMRKIIYLSSWGPY